MLEKKVKWFFFLLACLTVAYMCFATAKAGETTLSWTLPTGSEQCTADSTVPDIQSTEVWQLVSRTGPTVEEVTLTGLLPGDYEFISSVTDASGEVSRVSGAATKTIGPLVTTAAEAFTVVKSGGGFLAFVIGTVPLGTECDIENMVKGKYNFLPFTGYAVPIESVVITGDVVPSAVMAVCQ